jgi:hypothetical protein
MGTLRILSVAPARGRVEIEGWPDPMMPVAEPRVARRRAVIDKTNAALDLTCDKSEGALIEVSSSGG